MPSPTTSLSEEIRQALRLSASIPLILQRERYPSHGEKSAFTQWFSSVYVRSLKDQARKSKYPRTQILEPRTQSKLICHSSATFYPYVEQQPNIGQRINLYRSVQRPYRCRPPPNTEWYHHASERGAIENYIRYLYRYIWRKLEAEKGWATFASQIESTPLVRFITLSRKSVIDYVLHQQPAP